MKTRATVSESPPPGGWPLPRAAYVHVPFCRHRCGYCNFSVIAGRDELIDRFLRAVDQELAQLDRPRIDSLFIGGGTPTHLSAEQLDCLLACMRNRFRLDQNCEWSVEANPEDVDREKLQLMRGHGVNRLSLGVQSFNENKLRILERGHSKTLAASVIEMAAEKIPNLSIDLIFAAPSETVDEWRRDLDKALALPITHLSTYSLTFEKGTSFWSRRHRGDLHAVSESLETEMYLLARESAAQAGINQYEISNFARADYQCRHNIGYWEGRGWYAVGPGAARFVDGRREVNHRSSTTYLQRIESGETPVAESEPITRTQYARERAAFGVRMLVGIDADALSRETGIDLVQACGDAFSRCIDAGLLEKTGNRYRLTERGILFADTVASELLGVVE